MTHAEIAGRKCKVTLYKEQRIQDLWTSALKAAGASGVEFSAGPPSLDENDILGEEA